MSQIELTYKAREIEESLDIYFYRPFGYLIARISRILGLSPNAVTIISMILGIAAGHLFMYNSLTINLAGVLILIISEAFDSADGQLARMINNKTKNGRILDGLASNVIFLSIYIHLCLRIISAGGPVWIFIIAAAAGVSHSFQSAMGDYYRNCYLYFVVSARKGELHNSADLSSSYKTLKWGRDFKDKFLMRFYINYTYQQESLSRNFQKLIQRTKSVFGENIPLFFKEEYQTLNKPLIKYYNILTTNTRMIVLFAVIIVNRPEFYLIFEIVLFNLLLIYVTLRQENINKSLLVIVNHIGSKN